MAPAVAAGALPSDAARVARVDGRAVRIEAERELVLRILRENELLKD